MLKIGKVLSGLAAITMLCGSMAFISATTQENADEQRSKIFEEIGVDMNSEELNLHYLENGELYDLMFCTLTPAQIEKASNSELVKRISLESSFMNQPERQGTTVNPVETTFDSQLLLSGDANGDHKVTLADALTILQFIANEDKYPLTATLMQNADCYNSGDGITAMDAVAVQRYDTGAIDSLPYLEKNGNGTEINDLNSKREIADKTVKEYLSNSKVLQPDELPDTIRDKYIVIELGREDDDALTKMSSALSQAGLNYRNCKYMPQDTDDIDSELNKIRKELFFFVLENNLPADFYEIGTVQNMDDRIVMEYYYKDQIVPDMIYNFMDDHNYDRELICLFVAE